MKRAINPKHGVISYGKVRSGSDQRKKYLVVCIRHGKRLYWRCSCEGWMFHGKCYHVAKQKARQ